jgi:glycosyltransferase involved in cell wall biosynthesis
MHSYYNRQIPFCLVVNSYNNALNGLIYRNIDSILQQNYTNYHVVYTDDHSTDSTGLKVKEYLQSKNISQDKF